MVLSLAADENKQIKLKKKTLGGVAKVICIEIVLANYRPEGRKVKKMTKSLRMIARGPFLTHFLKRAP